jgi:hypothetical protein
MKKTRLSKQAGQVIAWVDLKANAARQHFRAGLKSGIGAIRSDGFRACRPTWGELP